MSLDANLLKLGVLTLALKLIAVFKNNITRWIIKTVFTTGELPLSKWYTWEFIQALDITKIGSLAVIASFTLVTFPLGMWIASFRASDGWAVQNIVGYLVGAVTFPVNMFIMNKYINEMKINRLTITGALLVELACFTMVAGSWLVYRGNKP